MNLFIPPLGTRLLLLEDWTFMLHEEQRNYLFGVSLGKAEPEWREYSWRRASEVPGDFETTIRAGNILKTDRIYIRKGSKEFDSVTFFLAPTARGQKSHRFWAKLEDVNRIVADVLLGKEGPLPAIRN